ncbi:hypothetical protein [Helicobacter bizzozeronii]|uniref:hypothetical protein n=1 Tax=Helicobacter bizzozeronii TaxID=56877 RepID=UPI001F46C800|nr:hypothetical protein [Helicobacter bizzozeronii]
MLGHGVFLWISWLVFRIWLNTLWFVFETKKQNKSIFRFMIREKKITTSTLKPRVTLPPPFGLKGFEDKFWRLKEKKLLVNIHIGCVYADKAKVCGYKNVCFKFAWDNITAFLQERRDKRENLKECNVRLRAQKQEALKRHIAYSFAMAKKGTKRKNR